MSRHDYIDILGTIAFLMLLGISFFGIAAMLGGT